MRWLAVGLVAWWSLAAQAASLPASRLPRVRLYGEDFVDLGAWAVSQNLRLNWQRASGSVTVSGSSVRLRFSVDSRRAEIEGVAVWLSTPITRHNEVVYVGALDLPTVLEPLLYPARNRPGRTVRTVVLDPGHGGRDPGYQTGPQQEKKLTLPFAQRLHDLLEEAGFSVTLTRTSDTYVELADRPALANRLRADVFVSLHFNATGGTDRSVEGVEVYCLTPAGAASTNSRGDVGSFRPLRGNLNNAQNILLAHRVQRSLTQAGPRAQDRGVRRARFKVLRTAEMPAILVEGGFLTAPGEGRRIGQEDYRDTLARAIVDGLVAYRRQVERPVGPG